MKPGSNFSPLPGTQAVVRAIAVLKTLGQSRSAFAMTDLGTATGLSKATIFRLLGALEHEGMVARDAASGGYRLGPELITLGVTALSATDLRTTARDELARLAEVSGETATLEVLLGWDVLIIDEVQGRYLLGSTPEIGRRWPAHATSTGKLLLALGAPPHFPPRLARLTPRTVVSRVELQRELARVRRRGYASAVDELEQGLVALAAPVRNHLAIPVAALSINGPSLRLGVKRRRELLHTLCQAANRVSRRLGATAAMLEVSSADALRTNSNPATS